MMKINDDLLPFEKEYYSECNKINFFSLSLTEIKFQIEFLEKICKKELEIYEKQSSQILAFINNFQINTLICHESEPSNLVKIISDLISVLIIKFQYLRIGLNECHKIFKNNVPIITKNIEIFKENILKKSALMMKESKNNKGNRDDLNKFLSEAFESVATNIFKGLVYIHQFFFLYSKAKNEFNMNIKTDIEKKTNNNIINIIINDFSERKYAKSEGVYFEPIHFGNDNNNLILKNDSENIVSLCNSYLYYGQTFIKCMHIRKSIISQFKKLINDIVTHSPNNLIEKISHIKDKILRTKNNFIIMGIGTEKSWDLLVQSWTFLYNSMNNFFQFCNEICTEELIEQSNDKIEEYKTFENEWEKYSKKIIDLRNKHTKYYTNEKKKQIKDNPKEFKIFLEKEHQIKAFLNKECYDFLNYYIPMIREYEKKRATEVQELCYKFKKLLKKNNEECIESSKLELENSSSIDIFQEVKDIFNKQNNKFQIRDFDNYMDNLKDKILSNIDFTQDALAQSVKSSLDNYLQNNIEVNSDMEPSLSESALNSMKENNQIVGESSNINKMEKENISNSNNNVSLNDNNSNNIINLNNNDLNSMTSIIKSKNSNSILKNKLSCRDLFSNENSKNNNLSIASKDILNNKEHHEKTIYKLNKQNNTILSNDNESSSLISINEDKIEENNIKREIKIKPKIEKIDIINQYYNDPLIKNRLLNRSLKINEMLIEIHFFERLKKATKERMVKFEKELKNDTNFVKIVEFDKIFTNKDIRTIPPLSLIFNYIFNPKKVIDEYQYYKSFFETLFLLRGDYNINILYDKSELDKIPKYFNDLNYVNNLFNNYSKNDLNLFLRQIDTWYKSFSFQLTFVHPIKKLTSRSNKINIRDVIIIYFISPTDLIVDYYSYCSDYPFADIFVSTSQYRFHSDIKFNKNLGRFTFKANAIVCNKITNLSENNSEDKLKLIYDEKNKIQLQFYTWEPFQIVFENGNIYNEVEADKAFAKHLKNTIFDYSEEKPENFDFLENSNQLDFESSSTSSSEDNLKNNKKKKKRKNKNIITNDVMYYGILFILGLFSIKTFFGLNKGILTFDNFINLLILISIFFILYKSKE